MTYIAYYIDPFTYEWIFFYKTLDTTRGLVYYTTNTLIEHGGDDMIQAFDDDRPIYIQIEEFIKRDIVSGRLNGGDKLPSIREMSDKFKVNPNTIQRAYAELEREGLTYTQRGMGTFVVDDEYKLDSLRKSMATREIREFVNVMYELGFSDEEIFDLLEDNLNK